MERSKIMMYRTFKTAKEAFENVRIEYADILKQADGGHKKVIDIAGLDELERLQKTLQSILAEEYPSESDDQEIQAKTAALYTAISSAIAEGT
ncbi:hypothetical protein J6S55_01065 [Candidatus Saccharibacteria bacterium]|nr:hypothetical protein [Candidatus Saccharibacteria bacterium]